MKTAISVPDDVFAEAERLAKKLKKSRSQLYSHAIREYVARHSDDSVTEILNEVIEATGDAHDDFATRAGQRRLRCVEW
jgi:metal-responsive CopG/Arc/MetJ family transcriptional regulator